MITELGGYDGQGYAFAYWGNQTGIAYDPEVISFEDVPQTVADFEAYFAANPGMFGFNYENGGSGPSFIQNIARNVTELSEDEFLSGEVSDDKMAMLQPAWDWFLENTDGYIITASNTDSLVRLSNREFAMVAAWEDHLFNLQNQGEVDGRIEFYIPEFGMNGGGNYNVVPANAPHPAAALVFMNWVSSAETQTRFNEIFGAAPMHPDADDSNALMSPMRCVSSRPSGPATRSTRKSAPPLSKTWRSSAKRPKINRTGRAIAAGSRMEFPMPAPGPIIAHRGASAAFPENTLLAIEKAHEAGCAWVEIDTHMTADGEIILMHDHDLDRTTGLSGFVCKHDLADIRATHTRFADGRMSDQRVPLLTEVLDLASQKGIGVVLEMKPTWGWDADEATRASRFDPARPGFSAPGDKLLGACVAGHGGGPARYRPGTSLYQGPRRDGKGCGTTRPKGRALQ